MIVSSTEPAKLRALGTVSTFPEQHGCDMLIATNGAWAGIQRKEVKDLLGSVHDGRLGEQILKMHGVEHRLLIIEGVLRWTLDGQLAATTWGRGISRANLRKLLWSIRAAGVWIEWSDSLDDTIAVVEAFNEWCRKTTHVSLHQRPAARGSWGTASNRDWQIHFLQGLPGIGVELAGRILDTVGMPVGWVVEPDELMRVEGLGRKKIERIIGALRTDNS